MKLVKSLLLGSAAGLCAAAGAQAADLPVRKAAPVEYVRVCTAYGAGFFYIPGTDTCLRVGGRARFEWQYTSNRTRNSDVGGFRGQGRLNIDARTQTPYGTLRAFIRYEIMSRTGAYQTSGTQQRYANAFFATGQDEFGRAQKYVDVDKAFIQFAGITAGRAASFFDFYAHDLEMLGASIGSDVANTNLLAYTATFGGGFSATLSIEDPVFRRNPTWATATVAAVPGFTTGATTFVGNVFAANGVPLSAVALDVVQRNYMPDIVGALRYDQPWGSAQLSAAVHELRTGLYTGAAVPFNGGVVPGAVAPGVAAPIGTPGTLVPRVPSSELGFAVQGGLKLNLPQLAPGDVLWLQVAYAQGAGSYTGMYVPQGSELNSVTYTNRFGSFPAGFGWPAGINGFGGYDMAVDAFGNTHLTETYSGTIAFLHYWTPEIRQGVFATFGRAHFDKALRGVGSPITGLFATPAGAAITTDAAFTGFAKDFSNLYVGSNLIWSPVRDLDIGVEVVYERLSFLGGFSKGKVFDSNKPVFVAGAPGAPLAGAIFKTISYDDNVLARFRVQRDF